MVSPITRTALNAPVLLVPVVVSRPDDVPLTVRCVLPAARPEIVRSLACSTVDRALSRRVTVPLTLTRVLTVFVVRLSNACCTAPPAVAYAAERLMVKPFRVSASHTTRPVAAWNAQLPFRMPPNLPRPKSRPNPCPKKSPPNPPPHKPLPAPPPGPRPPRIPDGDHAFA